MLDILISLLFATGNAAVLKHGELRKADRLGVMGVNYIFATLIAGMIWWSDGHVAPSGFTMIVGAIGGAFYAGALFLWLAAIGRTGIAVATAALRLGVVWPILFSIVFFQEDPTIHQGLGIGLSVMAVLLLSARQPSARRLLEHSAVLLLALFVSAGGPGTVLKVFSEMGSKTEHSALLVSAFFSAGIFCWVLILWGGEKPRTQEWQTGATFGVGNIMANYFLLRGLSHVPGVVVFPLINNSVLLLVTLIGVVVWHERPGRLGYGAIVCAGVGSVFISS